MEGAFPLSAAANSVLDAYSQQEKGSFRVPAPVGRGHAPAGHLRNWALSLFAEGYPDASIENAHLMQLPGGGMPPPYRGALIQTASHICFFTIRKPHPIPMNRVRFFDSFRIISTVRPGISLPGSWPSGRPPPWACPPRRSRRTTCPGKTEPSWRCGLR